jgi:cyclopropane-fatty-acyl-phospholipid synthase
MRKLLLKPGQRVLDIGSGWGGLAFYLAAHAEVEVVGITLSQEQLRVAQHEAQDRGLGDRVNFLLQDYREHKGEYDRIVSVGMFEHVGLQNYRAFFEQVRHLLKSDGVALLHTIGVSGKAGLNNVWIRRHIFPGSYLSTLSQITPAIEKTGLMITDIEVLRLHYAHTLGEWYRRFQSHRKETAERLGERFARMWEFYLASCEASFRFWDLVVFQVQMARQHGAVPITRDYLVRREA